jgi:hypothetical protein
MVSWPGDKCLIDPTRFRPSQIPAIVFAIHRHRYTCPDKDFADVEIGRNIRAPDRYGRLFFSGSAKSLQFTNKPEFLTHHPMGRFRRPHAKKNQSFRYRHNRSPNGQGGQLYMHTRLLLLTEGSGDEWHPAFRDGEPGELPHQPPDATQTERYSTRTWQ